MTDERYSQVTTRISATLHRQAKIACVQEGITLQEFIAAAIAAELKRRNSGSTRAA